jgi:hypothetical protein
MPMRQVRFHDSDLRWLLRAWIAVAAASMTLAVTLSALAAPQARILRIDPRASQESGNPILTTVIEVVQAKRVSDAVAHCAASRGNALFDCMSAALEQPFALYTPFGFPAKEGKTNAILTVKVGDAEVPADFVSAVRWGEQLQQPGVGTAWLIMIDADKRMGAAFSDARQVALQFISSMGPNDIVNVMFFNDRQVVKDSKWLPASAKSKAEALVNSVSSTYPSQGRNRSLLTIIKQGATDGFYSLGNVGETVNVPMHQALVLLSSGFGGTDPSTTGPGALELSKYLTHGRFPEENTMLPKLPVPVISVYFPHRSFDEFRQNSLDFMQNLANPDIGGFFTVMREGQGGRAPAVVNAVRTRFSKMHIVKWRVSCISPSVTQTFALAFKNVNPAIAGDGTFKEVPIGIDPTTWPLDVNLQYTQEMAKRSRIYPGGTLKLWGDFCWGGETGRAEVYFMPKGQQLPTDLSGADVDKAKRTQQQLIAMGMKGVAIEATNSYVEFEVPDNDKVLHGSGNQAVVRLVVYDNQAHRTSGVTADSIIQLPAQAKPLPILEILGVAFGALVLILLVALIIRSGGRKRGAAPPPAPVVAGAAPGYGAVPGGYGPAPGGYGAGAGGYGAPPAPAPPAGGYAGAPAPAAAPPAPAAAAGYGAAVQAAAAAPAGAGVSPEFMYGGQAPSAVSVGAPGPQPPATPPPDPYAQTSEPVASRATLQGAAGVFSVVPGAEMRAGRDGSQCGILLTEPRVSGVHATLKLEQGQLWLRDENSNNGTLLNGNRLAPGVWVTVPAGSLIRFGPVEFSVHLE